MSVSLSSKITNISIIIPIQDILENTHDHNQENKEEVIAAITAAIQKVKSSRENG